MIFKEAIILLLSIVVPVYNIEGYIGECLDSLIEQNLDKDTYEIIVVDDGSTDNSGNILDKYASKYETIKVFHKPNGGVSSARNMALDCAKGDYIWFVDGDDVIMPNALKDVLEAIKSNGYPDLLYVNVRAFIDGIEKPMLSSDELLGESTAKYVGWMFTRFYKRKIIENNNIRFDENVAFGEDDIFCVFVDQYVNTIAKLNKVVYFYRQRQGSALHSAITENNFEKFLRSYRADLDYANRYDFFWYKRDTVYKNMPNIMLFVAGKPHREAKKYLKKLKEYRLFPLPEYTKNKKELEQMNGAKKIRMNSYKSLKGYYILRAYLRLQKIKNKTKV